MYEEFNNYYNEVLNQSISLNSNSNIHLLFNDEKSNALLRKLSNYTLPIINYYWFDYIKEDSEDVRMFLKYSSSQKQLWFNYRSSNQLEGSKFIDALKAAARKTTDTFSVQYTKFNSHEFSDLISAAKGVTTVDAIYCTLSLDSEWNFGSNMDGCKINSLYLNYSGGSSYGNWKAKSNCFENLIAGISKCAPLASSLKTIYISGCDITRDDAQNVLNKYSLKVWLGSV